MFYDLPIPKSLHGDAVVCQATLEQLLDLSYQVIAKHLFHTNVYATAEVFGRTCEANNRFGRLGGI